MKLRSSLTSRSLRARAGRHDRPDCRARRCSAAELARPLRAGLAEAVRAAGALGPADRLVAAAVAVLVVGGAGGDRCRRDRAPNVWHLFLFLVGAIAMRGAGCTYNDLVDRDLDAQGGADARPAAALRRGDARGRRCVFLVLQALVGALVLLQFNGFTDLLGLASLSSSAIYPFMKRVTDWPQFVLGLAFSWGALVGWSATARQARAPRRSCSMPARCCGRSATTRSTRCRTRRTTR